MVFNRICILHLNQIGDLVFSFPLLKALRDAFPNAAIHSVVKPYLKELLSCTSYTDKILLRTGGIAAKLRMFRTIRKNRYDLLISLSRSHECLALAVFSGARVKAGFPVSPWRAGFDVRESIEGHNSWYNNAKILKRLGISVEKADYAGLLQANEDVSGLDLPERFTVISPGASKKRLTKAWDPEKFAELAVRLYEKYGLQPVLVGSKDNENLNRLILERVSVKKENQNMAVVDLTGKIGLKTLASLLKHARLFVGIDSGVMHMASSLEIPVVGLFGPTDPEYVGPQNKKSVVVRNETLDCVPCYLKDCDHKNCMAELSVESVMQACEQLSADFL